MKKPLFINGNYIRTEVWNHKRVLTARNIKGQLTTWGKVSSIKGGKQAALFNFKNIRKFKFTKDIKVITEKQVFPGSGIVKTGSYSVPGTELQSKPSFGKVIQYALKAVFKDGTIIYGSSSNINRTRQSVHEAQREALINLDKNISGVYSDEYGESKGRQIRVSKLPKIYHGWITYSQGKKPKLIAHSNARNRNKKSGIVSSRHKT